MRVSDATLIELLQKAGKLPNEQLQALQQEQKKTRRPLYDLILADAISTDEELTRLYSEIINVPFVKLDPKTITKETLGALPERIARQYNVVVFKKEEDGTFLLAMEDPEDVQALDFIKKQIGSKYRLHIATKEDVLLSLENYREGVDTELDKVIAVQGQDTEASNELVSEEDIAEDSPIAQTDYLCW